MRRRRAQVARLHACTGTGVGQGEIVRARTHASERGPGRPHVRVGRGPRQTGRGHQRGSPKRLVCGCTCRSGWEQHGSRGHLARCPCIKTAHASSKRGKQRPRTLACVSMHASNKRGRQRPKGRLHKRMQGPGVGGHGDPSSGQAPKTTPILTGQGWFGRGVVSCKKNYVKRWVSVGLGSVW